VETRTAFHKSIFACCTLGKLWDGSDDILRQDVELESVMREIKDWGVAEVGHVLLYKSVKRVINARA
jgi:hypothetical protein